MNVRHYSYREKEMLCSAMLASRPDHINHIVYDQEVILSVQRAQEALSVAQALESAGPTKKYELDSQLAWSSQDKPLGVFYILTNAQPTDKTSKPFIFYYQDQFKPYFTLLAFSKKVGFEQKNGQSHYCKSKSSAKMIMKAQPDYEYPGYKKGCIYVIVINSHSKKYRVGTALIQSAIEQSIEAGFAGRLMLSSANNTGQFYYKLGFAATGDFDFSRIEAGENCNGNLMYLPKRSINAWKNKIKKHRILSFFKEKDESLAEAKRPCQKNAMLKPH